MNFLDFGRFLAGAAREKSSNCVNPPCQRWKIAELALFGSILRDDFHPDSDIDFLVTFSPATTWSLLDWVEMGTAEVIYATG